MLHCNKRHTFQAVKLTPVGIRIQHMDSNQPPKQLFDHFFSGAKDGSWNRKTAVQSGCEIIVSNAAAQLEAMVEQFNPDNTGWHVLLIDIPGFNGAEWSNKAETLQTLIGQFAPPDARTWVYLLGGAKLGVLVHISAKPQLVAFVQRLGASLTQGQGSPRTRLAQIPSQKQVVKSYLAAEAMAEENAKKQQETLQAAQRLASISFALQPGIAAQRLTRPRPVVLIVEDDPVTLQVLEHLIAQTRGVEVLSARNATDAATLYRRNAPDLVFLDIGLPEIDGLTLLAKLREADPDAYVFILTANAYRSNLEQATRLGAKGFLAKPFTPAKISAVVTQAIKEGHK